jgi:hypothetical protein
MGNVVRGIARAAALVGAGVLLFVPGANVAAAAFIGSTLGVSAAVAATLVTVAASLSATIGSSLFIRRPGGGLVPFDPKNINVDRTTPRKIVFGRCAVPLDLRHAEPSSDSKQEHITYIFALAAHRMEGLDNLYIEDKLAWDGTSAVGEFAGYLTLEFIPQASASAFHTAEAGTKWGSATRLTGCATLKVRVKRTGNSKSTQSPFASGISGRWTLAGRGMPLYDPAIDSTVPGGSGSQRANDNSTWAYTVSSVERGGNPALQLLAYLLGWKINGVGSVGLGIDPARLNLPSFAAAAAICDESIALAAGGNHRRYEAGKAYTDADDPRAVMDELLAAMNGEVVHDGGKLALRLGVNDLTPLLTLTEADFVAGYQWSPAPSLAEQFTLVRGRYTQPSAPALFGLVDYPEVSTGRASAAPRPLSLELPGVQDVRRAERIATQVARMSANWGAFTTTLGIRGWGLRQNAVVALTIPDRGWTAKLFRVRSITLNPDATVAVSLRPEFAANYSWATSETGNVAPVTPITYSAINEPNGLWRVPVSRLDETTGLADTDFGRVGGLAVDSIVARGSARDGDAVTFESTLPGVPQIVFLPGGNAATAGQNMRIVAEGVTTSGFVLRAKSQAVTAGSTITDGSSTAGDVGEPDRIINRTDSGAPFDGGFVYSFSVTVGEIAPGEPGVIVIGLFVRRSSAWVQAAQFAYNSTGAKVATIFPGTVDFGTGSEFGVSVLSAAGTGTVLSAFTSVAYTLGSVTETSLTPSGASSIPWVAIL